MSFGFLNINKPGNITSHDVVTILRKSLGIKKIGHSGTLDPFATGVLVIGINEASRLFEYLPSNKIYLATITFGIETDTNDITGKVLERLNNFPTIDEIKEKIKEFTGKIKQRPPIFSAVKIDGQRAYNLARKSQINLDDIKEKEVEIYSIDIISYDVETYNNTSLLKLKIHCSSGTYIRSIARDLGRALNTCAVLSSLQRIKVGNCFNYEQSIDPQAINKLTLSNHLISPLSVMELEKIYLDNVQVIDVLHGKSIKVDFRNKQTEVQLTTSLLDNNNRLLGIGTLTDGCIIKPKKVFIKSE